MLARDAGVQRYRHRRKEYRPRSSPSTAPAQVDPPSTETSTPRMPLPPSKAIPSTSMARPAGTVEPASGDVMNERTFIRLIGIRWSDSFAWGSSTLFGLVGIWYAFAIQ